MHYERIKTDLAQQESIQKLFSPVMKVKILLGNPGLDKNQLLSNQKRMLELKKERLERIIASIEDMLKGDNKMDFSVFSKAELEQMYHDMERNMTDEQKEIFVKEYGSMEAFKKELLDYSISDEAQKNLAKMVEWYGSKESAQTAATTNQPVPEGLEELLIPEATWCVASGDPYRPATFEDLFRGLYLEFFPSTSMDYAALPDIEVYPLEGKGLGTPIKEAWFAVKRIDDDETPQNVS